MAKKILVASGKGGVGKSAFSVLVGESLANRNKKVLAIELDSRFRSLDVALGISSSVVFDLGDIINGNCNVCDAAKPCPFCKNLSVICASVSESTLTKDSLDLICNAGNDFDYIIFDCPAGITGSMIAAASVSDIAIIIATADPSSVRAAKTTAGAVREVGTPEIRLVIDRCPSKAKELVPFKNLDEIIDSTELQLLGVLWEDPYTRISVDSGVLLNSKSKNRKNADDIALRIMGNRVPLGFK